MKQLNGQTDNETSDDEVIEIQRRFSAYTKRLYLLSCKATQATSRLSKAT